MTNKAVSRWETGEGYPEITLLVPLANALGTTVDDLLGNCETQISENKKTNVYQNFLIGTVLNFIIFLFFGNLVVFTLLEIGLIFYYLHFRNTDKDVVKVWKLVCIFFAVSGGSLLSLLTMPTVEPQFMPIIDEAMFTQSPINYLNYMPILMYICHILKWLMITSLIMMVIYRIGIHYCENHKSVKETTLMYWNQNRLKSNEIKYFDIIHLFSIMIFMFVPIIIYKVNHLLHTNIVYHTHQFTSQVYGFVFGSGIIMCVLIMIFSKFTKGKYSRLLMLSNIGTVIIEVFALYLSVGTQTSFALGYTYEERITFMLNYKTIILGVIIIAVYMIVTKTFLYKKISNEN